MSELLNNWAMINTIVIMLALGMVYRPAAGYLHVAILARAAIGYNFIFPALGLTMLASFTTWFSAETLMAMALCIAAAGGTSAGAFVNKVDTVVTNSVPFGAMYSATLTAKLLIILLGLSVSVIAGLAVTEKLNFGALSITKLCSYLLLISLAPFLVGITLTRHRPQLSLRWQPLLERSGTVLVVLLIRPTNATNHNLNPIGKTVGWISKAPSTSNNLDLHRNIG